MSNLDTLMKHAGVEQPEHIAGYLMGFKGTYDPAKVTPWLNGYRTEPYERLYDFMIPWNTDITRTILERIRDTIDDEVLVSNAAWALEALDEQEGRDDQ